MKVEIKNLVPGYYCRVFDEETDTWVKVQVIEAGNGKVKLKDEEGPLQGWEWNIPIVDIGNINHFKTIEDES